MKRNSSKKGKVIVVGAGAAGLSTAVQLAHQGWDVTIFEKEHTAGGRLSAIEASGYTIDIGPTILMMNDVFHQFFREIDRNLEDYVDLVRLNPCYRLNFADGTSIAPSTDLKEHLDEIRRISPEDVDGYLKYLAQINPRYLAARHKFIEKNFNSLGDFLNVDTLVGMWQLKTLNSMYADISRYIKDERLRIALTFQAIYLGISPYDAPSIYTIIAYVEHGLTGIWYPKGGMNAISKALVRVFEEQGGQLHLNQEVTQIVIEKGEAKGVKLANGEIHYADVVVSNMDFPMTMEKLIVEPYRGKYSAQKIQSMTNSCGALMLYLGTNRRYEQMDVHNIYFTKSYKETLDQIFKEKVFPDDPALYVYSPTKIDPTVAPEGKEVIYVLCPVPNLDSSINWQESVPIYREKILDKLERSGLTDLRKHIDFERIYTPETFNARFNTYQGSGFGLAPTLFQSGYFRPHIKSKDVSNLYFVGASVHPGGGVPVVLVCGQLATRQIMADKQGSSVEQTYSVATTAKA
ncbi:phytoene desaturase family protein [Heliorestis convoluta]|uniref:Diapophytoene dehydrogenase CrtN n=1 Tax=Heliorestis convoluta TaxID=356322 RepID=A0A5Q2N370_9FIRM|nr:phytoene desaturase family protein [Heliorestis convoluta]QGG48741.1 Diapophytoene dehydrogenase CrtN [Heliorestis convoluta]